MSDDDNSYRPGREDRDPPTPGERWIVGLLIALVLVAILFTARSLGW